jgi:hypothetical protein
VVAALHNTAVIADFEAGALRPLGSGGQLVNPFSGFAVGDTFFLADWAKQRLTVWTRDGRLVDSIPAPTATRGVLPKARDAAGQFYFEIPPIPGPDGSGNRDSIAVVRSDARMTRFDTVARLAPLDIAEAQMTTGKRYERLIFSGNDWWGVRPDGRIWIARVNLSRVNTAPAGGGKETRGEPLPDPVLEVRLIDRQAFIASFPDEVQNTLKSMPFAPMKPPFERGFAGSDGQVWLRKSRAYEDSLRRYHVVNPEGQLERSFTLTGDAVIVAASSGTALAAEVTHVGLLLMEIRLPDPPPPPAEEP